MFRVEITDDDGSDPYFLYLWSVSEEEFHELKQQQRLLVDFVTFPTNLIELLQCCLADSKKTQARQEKEKKSSSGGGEDDAEEEDTEASHSRGPTETETNPLSRSQGPVPLRLVGPCFLRPRARRFLFLLPYFADLLLLSCMCSYLAVLNTSDADGRSVFSIVETNPFKHLTHLSLQFFPGDDAAIKAYLAARLAQISADKRCLSATLKQTSSELRKTQQSEAFLQKRLETMTQQTESTISREKMKYADDLNAQVTWRMMRR